MDPGAATLRFRVLGPLAAAVAGLDEPARAGVRADARRTNLDAIVAEHLGRR